ncbi:MAG: Imm17 family immunity protein [Pirellulaceae bacterium]
MIQGQEDLVVGSVAVVLGVFLITTALRNWEWWYTLHSSRWLERRLTRFGVRVLHAALGLALMVLGLAIMQGFRWQLWH